MAAAANLEIEESPYLINVSSFVKTGSDVRLTTPKSKNEFVGSQHRTTLPVFWPQKRHFVQKGTENPNINYANFCL